jgi:CDP-diacylglycerol---serine O-phosphatidyltransferase
VTIAAALLMVSKFAYFSFKELSPRGRIAFSYVILIPAVFALIAIDPPTMLFALSATYAASALLVAVWRRRARAEVRARAEGRERHRPMNPDS